LYEDKEMNYQLFEWLIILGLVLFCLYYYRSIQKTGEEGFQQDERFLLKTDEEIYDDFYCEIYDTLWEPKISAKYEVDKLIGTMQPDKETACMLDVGAGTGSRMKEWKHRGFDIQGIDQSQAMANHGSMDILVGNVLDPMAFDRNSFSHIFCMDFTLYEFADKLQFFKNCSYWLKNKGYLVLHLADLDRFNPLVPAAKPAILLNSLEQLGPERVKRTEIDFIDFIYVSDYLPKGSQILHTESFTDKHSGNVRQNERTLYKETDHAIWEKVKTAGFIPKGAFSLIDGPARDAAQQIIILERGS